jgi:hypothetical protein
LKELTAEKVDLLTKASVRWATHRFGSDRAMKFARIRTLSAEIGLSHFHAVACGNLSAIPAADRTP